MTYFPDLSRYAYLPPKPGETRELINIGWLDKDHPFPVGKVPPVLQGELHRALESLCNRTRGYHRCNLCGDREPVRVRHRDREFVLGDAEIHIPAGGRVYVSPNLIIHYVDQHSYQPPAEFVDAVLAPDQDD